MVDTTVIASFETGLDYCDNENQKRRDTFFQKIRSHN